MARPLTRALIAIIAVVSLASCGGKAEKPPTTTAATKTSRAALSVLGSRAERVTFDDVDSAITRLYRRRPGIRTFVVRDVEYSPLTLNKVLDICHRGGLELNRAALESSRVAACAPLIFFFYNYGQEKSVPDAIRVARKIYWYAVGSIHGPFDARATLDALLRTWAVG
jgi:hypothetical protein